MKSPITGKDMPLAYEWRKVPFRKEVFKIPYQYYACQDTGEAFTTTALDELNMRMVYNQYRVKHKIPLPEEIQKTRVGYGVSASRMGEILGFGPNTYGQYEKGDMPTTANAKLLKMAEVPTKFLELVHDWDTNAQKAKAALTERVQALITAQQTHLKGIELYLMGSPTADLFSGFKSPDYAKLTEMIVFFAGQVPCFKTKMNKLLFYTDFAMFKQHGQSISGTRYRAIPYGPVPNNFESIFEGLARQDVIDMIYEELPQGGQKQFLKGRADRPFNKAVFTANELAVLEQVQERFKTTMPFEIVEISHQEKAWIENEPARAFINYNYALDLKAL